MEAHELALMTPEEKLEKITKNIEENKPQLFDYGHKGHAMLLNLVPNKDGQFIDCEIFNSGSGLKYHERFLNSEHYQTMKTNRIQKSQLTKTKLQQLIECKKFKNTDEAYQAILNIPGAQGIMNLPYLSGKKRKKALPAL